MEKTITEQKTLMSKQVLLEQEKTAAKNPAADATKTEDGPPACPVHGKGWVKGALGMAICCAAPLLLFAAIAFSGLSLGALASGTLSLAALLACPVGMFLMMRMVMKDKK